MQLSTIPHCSTINSNRLAVNITPCFRAQKHDHPRDIVRFAQPPQRIRGSMLVLPTAQFQKARRHLGREEPRTDAIHRNKPWAQLDRQVPPQMQHRRLTRTVAIRRLLSKSPNRQARHR